jgi:PAS domain S-box-containing protein
MYRKPAVQLATSYAAAGSVLVAIFWAATPAETLARMPLGAMKDAAIVIGTTVLLYAIVTRLGRSVQSRYELMFANNPNPMMIYHRENFRILAVNDIAIAHYGYSRDKFLSMTIMDIRPVEDVPALREYMSHVAGLAERNGIWRHIKKDGSIISVEVASHDIPFNGQRARLCCIYDVTRR